MTINEVRQKYLEFFENKGHKIISPAPLVLENDPTTLFTSSGMQPLVQNLISGEHPEGKRLVDSQSCIRTQDIEEVGDNRHTTYFEMLGNWSLGDYFKQDQLAWFWQFLTEELNLPKDKLYVSIFEGNESVPRDEESFKIWKSLGIEDSHIFEYGVEDNWWSRSGVPDNMPIGEIGGPDSEVFFEFTDVKHDKKFGEKCQPSCDCGRFLEIGNSVFIQYIKNKQGKLEELPNKNVDFGGGLERLAAATNNDPDVFKIDVFQKIILKIEELSGKKYEDHKQEFRIIADHTRAAESLIAEGVEPSNKQQGYVLRRLIRRAAIKVRAIHEPPLQSDFEKLTGNKTIIEEAKKFKKTLEKGLREVEKIEKIDGKQAFDLFQTFGFPLEITEEIFEEKGQKINKEEFKQEFEKHKQLSRSASAGTFKGGLADNSEQTTKLHTATHLLHQALRLVLGDHVQQKGSNITAERLRFDFTHSEKLTEEQIKQIENIINKQIKNKLSVTKESMSLEEAKAAGALAFFDSKYDNKVNVYSIGPSANSGQAFSREVCGGPHVANTSEIGHVKIIKEQSASAGVRRIYASIKII